MEPIEKTQNPNTVGWGFGVLFFFNLFTKYQIPIYRVPKTYLPSTRNLFTEYQKPIYRVPKTMEGIEITQNPNTVGSF